MDSRIAKIRSQLLLLRYRRGEDEALSELVEMWEQPLFYYIRRIVPTEEDAWDALQETWIRVVRAIGQLRDLESFPSWLYRIARNATANYLRDDHRNNPVADEEMNPAAAEGRDDHGFSPEDAEAIHRGLQRLPVVQREVLTLFFLEEFTLEEISSIIGIPKGTVKSRLHYAKKALRKLMTKEEPGHE